MRKSDNLAPAVLHCLTRFLGILKEDLGVSAIRATQDVCERGLRVIDGDGKSSAIVSCLRRLSLLIIKMVVVLSVG